MLYKHATRDQGSCISSPTEHGPEAGCSVEAARPRVG